MIAAQASAYAECRACEKCDSPLRHNGNNTIVVRTPFGKVDVDSPRFYRCICVAAQSSKRSTFSPLAELLPERTTLEFSYLQTKFSALMSYGLTLKVLTEILPIDKRLDKPALRDNVARVVRRLDSELDDEPQSIIAQDLSEQQQQSPDAPPVVVAIDGGYVHGRSKTGDDGCFVSVASVPSCERGADGLGCLWLSGSGLEIPG